MTDPTPATGMPSPPPIPSGDELYNQIMGPIEMDLTTENMPLLDKKYAGESEADRAARMERYKAAFAEYQKQFEAYQVSQRSNLRSFRNNAVKFVESKSQATEADDLSNLEASIANL